MTLIERLLCKVFPYTDIMRDGTDELYLRRWFLYPRDKDFGNNKGKGRLYLHKFYRGDEDPHLHSHPWAFTSLILTRGYWEEVPMGSIDPGPSRTRMQPLWVTREEDDDSRSFSRRFYPRFSLLRRPATWQHRVILKDKKPVWTIVKTGVKERSWGFWIRGKMCPWRIYHDGVCWCDEGAD